MVAISHRARALLQWEVQNINGYLENNFYPPNNGEVRLASLGSTGEYITVQNFPLPDGFRPDYIDVLLIVDGFPARPPTGLYILNRSNDALVRQLKEHFNAYQDNAYHGAQAINGYTWVCYHYQNNAWKYRADMPAHGDNVQKFLNNFLAELDR